jgi:dTDP-4-amino-4,6-dideoxygalactose transaminase
LVVAQKLRLLSLAVSKKEKTGGMPAFINWQFSPALGFLLDNQLNKITQYTKHRRHLAKFYISKLKLGRFLSSMQDNASWIRIPFTVSDPKQIIQLAQKHKILLGDWYLRPVTPTNPNKPNVTQYQQGSCPNAEKACRHIINLPTHPGLSQKQAALIVDFINQVKLTDTND